jgi:hypothetical protein
MSDELQQQIEQPPEPPKQEGEVKSIFSTTLPTEPESEQERKLRMLVDFCILGFTSVFGSILYFGGLYFLFSDNATWLVNKIDQHFAGVIMPPLMMLGAIVVVTALKMSETQMKFSLLGFNFEGSAAPIIMWVLVYLVITLSVRILWYLV